MGREYITQLTGLRGAAAILVVISHAADVGMAPVWLGGGFGKIGVLIFFVLSSYLMTTLYLGKSVSHNWQSYVFARIGRVFPLYLLIVMVSIIAAPTFPSWRYNVIGATEILHNLFFIKANHELWAVPVEVQFYLVFLSLWALSEKFIQLHKLLPLSGLIALVWAVPFGLVAIFQPSFNTLGHAIHFFLLGMALAIWEKPIARRFPHAFCGWWGVAIVCILLVICAPWVRKEMGTYISLWVDPIVVGSVLIIFLTVRHGGRLADLLNAPLMQFLGNISYGLYLIHAVVLYFWVEVLNGRVLFMGLFLTLGVSIGLASLSFRYFEQPAARLIRKIPQVARGR